MADHSRRQSNTTDNTSNPDQRYNHADIQRILHEVGLNPSDYIFSPIPGDSSPEETSHSQHHHSAFSHYPYEEQQQNSQLSPQSNSLFHSSQSTGYVQQPPPASKPPPQSAATPTPPPPPPQFQPPPPPPLSRPPPPPLGQQNPPPQSGPPIPPFQPPKNSTPAPPLPPPPQDMNSHIFSPRRSPPPPPPFSTHPHESSLSAEHYLHQINSHEVPPVKVVKPNTQNLVYRKEIRIRYLQPPTPPPPAPIIIREKHAPLIPPQSPLLIRERKPEARTPPPLTIREHPPTPPAPLEPYVIEKTIPAPPPQPRQIIIERLPTPPPKPRTVIFEKWLPYKKVKRPVLLQHAPPLEPSKPTRNVIIEYEPLRAHTVRRVIEEGVFRVDPQQYASYNNQSGSSQGEVRFVERIEDLPPPSEQLTRVLQDYNQPIQHSPSHMSSYDYHHSGSEHIPPSIHQLLSDARPVSNTDPLTNISRASSIPAYRQERVLSTGYNSSNPSPSIIPIERSRSKHSYRYSQAYSPHQSPARSHTDDIY